MTETIFLHKYQCHTLFEIVLTVLIRDARGVTARLLLMLVTTHHAKHLLNYEHMTSGRIMHIFGSVLAYENVMRFIKYSAQIFSSFLQCVVELMQ